MRTPSFVGGETHPCVDMKKSFFILLIGLSCALANETIFLPGVSEYGGWVDYNKSLEDPDDDNLCWAAAASNVIDYWQSRYVIPACTPTGEDIWTTLKSSVNANIGGYTIGAMQWWLTGHYAPVAGDGSRRYVGYELPGPHPIDNGTLNGQVGFTGFYRYLEGENSDFWYDESLSGVDVTRSPYKVMNFMSEVHASAESFETASTTLRDALLVGSGITTYLYVKIRDGEKEDIAAHAVTLWGAEFDDNGQVVGLWLTEPDDNQYYEDAGLFYAALMSDRTLSLTLPGEDGDATYNYYQLVAENGWYSAESNYTFYLGNFEIFDITESDRWGLQRLIPEPTTTTLSLLALAALVARRRRR